MKVLILIDVRNFLLISKKNEKGRSCKRLDHGVISHCFNDTSTLMGQIMSSPQERVKRERGKNRVDTESLLDQNFL